MHSHKVAPTIIRGGVFSRDVTLDTMSGHRAAEQDHIGHSDRLLTRCLRRFDLDHAVGTRLRSGR